MEWIAVAAGFFLALFWEIRSRTMAKRREGRIVRLIERIYHVAEAANGHDTDLDMGLVCSGERVQRD